jgi:hypothetical protein
MTMAVCFKCGAIKFGAFCPCPECQALPKSEDDLALSLAMTDHYFDMPTLEQMGAAVRDGNPPHLDPETRANLVNSFRGTGLLEQLKGMWDASPSPDGPPGGSPR